MCPRFGLWFPRVLQQKPEINKSQNFVFLRLVEDGNLLQLGPILLLKDRDWGKCVKLPAEVKASIFESYNIRSVNFFRLYEIAT